MPSRRSFFLSAAAIALAPLLSGCQEGKAALKIMLLEGSIPSQFPDKFRSSLPQPRTLSFQPKAQLKELYQLLKIWQQKNLVEENKRVQLPLITQRTPAIANLVTLGDYWLAEAIRQQLIQPLNVETLSGWQNLPPRWQKLVRRNETGELDEKGKIWAAPYRWGSTIIAYRRDKFKTLGWEPKDWSDLWREELRDRISLLDQPREVIGLTLKKLGYSYNMPDLAKVSVLKSELQALNRQVKFYSSQNYLQPLILGDTWLAVGWSTDILPLRSRYSNIEAIIPHSGTAIWTDLWVQPKLADAAISPAEDRETNDILYQWIDFCWQPEFAQEISLFTNAASPIILMVEKNNVAKNLPKDKLILPKTDILRKSDFLLPFSLKTRQEYQSLWKEIRTDVS